MKRVFNRIVGLGALFALLGSFACGTDERAGAEGSTEPQCDPDNCEQSGCEVSYMSLLDEDNVCRSYRPYCTREEVDYFDEGLERTTPMLFEDAQGQCWLTYSTGAPVELKRIFEEGEGRCGQYLPGASAYTRELEDPCYDPITGEPL